MIWRNSPLLVTPPTVTATGPLPAPTGTRIEIWPLSQAVAVPAPTPLNVTVLIPWAASKLYPQMVTTEPGFANAGAIDPRNGPSETGAYSSAEDRGTLPLYP